MSRPLISIKVIPSSILRPRIPHGKSWHQNACENVGKQENSLLIFILIRNIAKVTCKHHEGDLKEKPMTLIPPNRFSSAEADEGLTCTTLCSKVLANATKKSTTRLKKTTVSTQCISRTFFLSSLHQSLPPHHLLSLLMPIIIYCK
jgi:hypothetical protein